MLLINNSAALDAVYRAVNQPATGTETGDGTPVDPVTVKPAVKSGPLPPGVNPTAQDNPAGAISMPPQFSSGQFYLPLLGNGAASPGSFAANLAAYLQENAATPGSLDAKV
jgi:hypothetical protein